MLENFHLAAIVKQQGEIGLLRIPLLQGLQTSLADSWSDQYDSFVDDVEHIDFDAGYTAEEHERFVIKEYEPPVWLQGEDSTTAPDLDSIAELPDDDLTSIRGLAAFARDGEGDEVVLFQNFTRSHVIKPGRYIFLQHDTYQTSENPGLTLDDRLSAVYWPTVDKLLFHKFRAVNTFLPLAALYEEASEEEISEVLGHPLLDAEDIDALAKGANQWFRKRFALLRDSGVLDDHTAAEIRTKAHGYEVGVVVRNHKVVFPAERREAKKLLQFLVEELYRGAITDTLYETNSKREAD
jgi:hypothetical protein